MKHYYYQELLFFVPFRDVFSLSSWAYEGPRHFLSSLIEFTVCLLVKNELKIIVQKTNLTIAIDFGLKSSHMAVFVNGSPHVIPNAEGETSTPSVVAYTAERNLLVGTPAVEQSHRNPENTFFFAKAFLGRMPEDVREEEVDELEEEEVDMWDGGGEGEVLEEVEVEMMISAENLNDAGAFQPVVKKRSAKPSPPKQQPSHQPQANFGDLLQSRRERYINQQSRVVRPKTTMNSVAAPDNAAAASASAWQPGCGLQCANLGNHVHNPVSSVSASTTATNANSVNQAARQHHQQRVENGESTNGVLLAFSQEAELRQRMLAIQQVKEQRPTKKFNTGTATDFRCHLANFRNVVDIPGLTSKSKMSELSHWFEGSCANLIASRASRTDIDSAYEEALEELSFFFGGATESITAIVKSLISGKQIPENDYKAHLDFYADLIKAESQAQNLGQLQQLDQSDTLAEIIENRLVYLAPRWWRSNMNRRELGYQEHGLYNLKKNLQDIIYMLGSRMAIAAPPAKINATSGWSQQQQQQQTHQQQHQQMQQQPQQLDQQQMQQQQHQFLQPQQPRPNRRQARFARQQQATATAPPQQQPVMMSYVNALTEAPQAVQSTDKCNCCGGMHSTETCNVLMSLPVDERAEKCKALRLCYGCLSTGHERRFCPSPPRCATCSRAHLTIFHGRTPRPRSTLPAQPQQLSVNAMTFAPAPMQFHPMLPAAAAQTAAPIPAAAPLPVQAPTNVEGSIL